MRLLHGFVRTRNQTRRWPAAKISSQWANGDEAGCDSQTRQTAEQEEVAGSGQRKYEKSDQIASSSRGQTKFFWTDDFSRGWFFGLLVGVCSRFPISALPSNQPSQTAPPPSDRKSSGMSGWIMSDAASVKSDTHSKATIVRGREDSLEELGESSAVESEAFSGIRHRVRSGE